MDLYIRDADKYSKDLRQGNKFIPEWPFRMVVSGSSDYFSSERYSNVSPIYVSQRFFFIPKTIRDNLTYILLHRRSGNLLDLKRIISPYTEHPKNLVPVIDDLTLKKNSSFSILNNL